VKPPLRGEAKKGGEKKKLQRYLEKKIEKKTKGAPFPTFQGISCGIQRKGGKKGNRGGFWGKKHEKSGMFTGHYLTPDKGKKRGDKIMNTNLQRRGGMGWRNPLPL